VPSSPSFRPGDALRFVAQARELGSELRRGGIRVNCGAIDVEQEGGVAERVEHALDVRAARVRAQPGVHTSLKRRGDGAERRDHVAIERAQPGVAANIQCRDRAGRRANPDAERMAWSGRARGRVRAGVRCEVIPDPVDRIPGFALAADAELFCRLVVALVADAVCGSRHADRPPLGDCARKQDRAAGRVPESEQRVAERLDPSGRVRIVERSQRDGDGILESGLDRPASVQADADWRIGRIAPEAGRRVCPTGQD
jgi:hypothetical protein